MANGQLPAYLASAKPNPIANRGPWYTNTAPAYFGIFMWVAFFEGLGGNLAQGGLDVALGGLVVAAVVCHYLFHNVFGILGMKTGYPLYVVGSSTFGTKGGLLFPGIFMGLLQIGWYSVGTYFATKLMFGAFGYDAHFLFAPEEGLRGFSLLVVMVAIAWGYIFALFGAFGIQYVARISSYLPWIVLGLLAIGAVCALPYVGDFKSPKADGSGLPAACGVLAMVVGFFASAGAAGADFGTNSRDKTDVNLAGLIGISLSIILAGGLALIIVAGAQGMMAGAEEAPSLGVSASLKIVSPQLGKVMLLLLAIGSMAPSCFCSNIIGNSLSTMIPSIGRVPLTLGGATIGIILAAIGTAGHLGPFFGFIGSSFGPICGAIVADYLLSGRKWAGPREGINLAGYGAWICGFVVGISNNSLLFKANELPSWYPADWLWQPTPVYSFIVGFVVYAVLAKAGLQPKTIEFEGAGK